MLNNLKGKTALISGAAQGIGRAIARSYHTAGAHLILVDQSLDPLKTLKEEFGKKTSIVEVDISDAEQLETKLSPILNKNKAVDILVNNAAARTRRAPITELSLEEWQTAISVNLTGAFLLSRMVIPQMQALGSGVIINIASQLGHVAIKGAVPYCTTKGGMLQFTRTLALDHAEDGIRVVALSPGAVLTPRLTEIYGTAEQAEKALKTAYPLGRLGEAEEIAKAALFLASDASSFITGTDLLVDGGYSAQ